MSIPCRTLKPWGEYGGGADLNLPAHLAKALDGEDIVTILEPLMVEEAAAAAPVAKAPARKRKRKK